MSDQELVFRTAESGERADREKVEVIERSTSPVLAAEPRRSARNTRKPKSSVEVARADPTGQDVVEEEEDGCPLTEGWGRWGRGQLR